MKIPRVVIVGRPNVGKSTLFNRLTRSRRALVHDRPGVTRDWTSKKIELGERTIELVDTGGLDLAERDPLASAARGMALRQLERADVLVVVVDGAAGPLAGDREVADLVRPLDRPVVLAVNKADVKRTGESLHDFWQLGLGEPIAVSAEHGTGREDLEEEVAARLPAGGGVEVASAVIPRIAVVGRPNVGKSSLVNRILGEERMIVSDVPGTTRDSVDSLVTAHGRSYALIDTAGIRRASRTATSPDILASVLAERSLAQADVALLVIDAHVGPTTKDAGIAGQVVASRAAAVILANKWDLGPPEGIAADRFTAEVRRELPMLDWAEVIMVSAVSGRRLGKVWEAVERALAERSHRIGTAVLNRFVATLGRQGPPLVIGGRPAKLRYLTQVGVTPPTFALFTNRRGPLAPPSANYLENRLREHHPFTGTPIVFRTAEGEGERPRRKRGRTAESV